MDEPWSKDEKLLITLQIDDKELLHSKRNRGGPFHVEERPVSREPHVRPAFDNTHPFKEWNSAARDRERVDIERRGEERPVGPDVDQVTCGCVPSSTDLLQDQFGGQVSQIRNVQLDIGAKLSATGDHKCTPSVGKAVHPNRSALIRLRPEDYERFPSVFGDLQEAPLSKSGLNRELLLLVEDRAIVEPSQSDTCVAVHVLGQLHRRAPHEGTLEEV